MSEPCLLKICCEEYYSYCGGMCHFRDKGAIMTCLTGYTASNELENFTPMYEEVVINFCPLCGKKLPTKAEYELQRQKQIAEWDAEDAGLFTIEK